jgi:hypothetical protein
MPAMRAHLTLNGVRSVYAWLRHIAHAASLPSYSGSTGTMTLRAYNN